MIRMKAVLIFTALVTLPAATLQAKPKNNVLCALASVHQCEASGCTEVAPELVGIESRFIEIDFKKNLLRGKETGRETKFKFDETPEGRWVLHGTEGNEDGDLGGVGYVMNIDPSTADFNLTIAASDFSLSLFGACTNQ